MQIFDGLHDRVAQGREIRPPRLAIVLQTGRDMPQPQRADIARQPLDGMQPVAKRRRVLSPFGLDQQALGFRGEQGQDFHTQIFIPHRLMIEMRIIENGNIRIVVRWIWC